MASWASAVPAVLAAVLILALPGALVLGAWSRRGLPLAVAAGLAAPASIALVTLVGIGAQVVGIGWRWWLPSAVGAAAALVVLLLPRAGGSGVEPGPARTTSPISAVSTWLTIAGVLVAFGSIAARLVGALDSPALVPQNYDGVFHLNAAQHILSSGDASSLTLYTITHPADAVHVYPAAWHATVASVAQLTGCGIPVASTAVWLVVAGLVWPVSVVLLTRVLFGNRPLLLAGSAGAAAAFASFPLLLLDWGTLYPTFLAYAILPAGIAALALVAGPGPRLAGVSARAAAVLLAAWLVAAAGAHPRSLATAAVVAAPLLVAAASSFLRNGWAEPTRRGRTLAIAAAVAAASLIAGAVAAVALWRHYAVPGRSLADRLNGGPARAVGNVWQALGDVLVSGADPSTGARLAPSLVVATLTVVGIVVIVLRRRHRWLLAAIALLALLYALAAGSDSGWAKLATGLWYKDNRRLISALPALLAPLAAIGGVWIADRVALWAAGHARRWGRTRPVRIAADSIALAALGGAALLSPGLADVGEAVRGTFALSTDPDDGRLLTADEYALLTRLPEVVPVGAVILDDPADGGAYAQAVGGRTVVFPHFAGDWSGDQLLLAARIGDIGSDAEVCAAARRLGVGFVLSLGPQVAGGGTASPSLASIDSATATGALTPVAANGSARLLAVSACAEPALPGSG